MEKIINKPEYTTKVLTNEDFAEVMDYLKVVDAKTKIMQFGKIVDFNNETIKDIQNVFKEIGVEESSLVAMIYRNNYASNLNSLTNFGYKLDDAQIKKYIGSLVVNSEVFSKNLETLNSYGISILKPGTSKLALNVLSVPCDTLVERIDDSIEVLGEEVLENNVESLAYNATAQRVAYLEQNNMPYKSSSGKFKAVTNPYGFNLSFKVDLNTVLPTKEENNASLNTVLGTDLVVNKDNTMNTDDQILYQGIIQLLGEKEVIETKLSYKLGDSIFSKKKFERNLEKIISSNKELSNEQTLLAALAYNSNKSEEEIKKVSEALGFSLAMGGR